jgi:pyridoxine kinase
METWAFALPTVDVPFTGTGDLLSALCTAWYGLAPSAPSSSMPPLAWALSKALLTVQQVLLRTYLHMLALETHDPVPVLSTADGDDTATEIQQRAQLLRRRELRIVQERALIADGGTGWEGRRVDWDAIATKASK